MASAAGLVIILAVFGGVYCFMMLMAAKRRGERYDSIASELRSIKRAIKAKRRAGRGDGS